MKSVSGYFPTLSPYVIATSLRSRLITLVVVAVLPVLLFSGGLLVLLWREQTRNVELVLRGTTRALGSVVDEKIGAYLTGLRTLAASEDFSSGNLPSIYQRAKRAVQSDIGWHSIAFADLKGKQLANTLRPLGEPLPFLGNFPFVKKIARSGLPAVSGFHIGRLTGARLVSFGVPVKQGPNTRFILIGTLRVEALQSLLAAQNTPPDWTAALVDSDLTIIARTRMPERFVGRHATPRLSRLMRESGEHTFHDQNKEGTSVYGTFKESPTTGWTMVLALPEEAIFAPVKHILFLSVTGGLLLLLTGIGLALILGRKIAAPMAALADMATRFGKGEVAPQLHSDVLEIADVADALERASVQRAQQEETLREANETFDALIGASPIAILALDAQGVVQVWNPHAELVFGYAVKEVLSRRLSELGAEDFAELEKVLRDSFGKAPQRSLVHRLTNRLGENVVLQISTATLRTPQGENRYVLAIAEDITERTQTLERLAEERHTVDTLHHIGASLSGELSLRPLLQRLTDEATDLTGAEFGAYFHLGFNDSGEAFDLFTVSGAPYEAFTHFNAPRNTPLFDPTFRGTGVIRLDDVREDPRFGKNPPYFGLPPGHLPVRSYLAVPVISRSGDLLGALFFGHSRPAMFTERQERLITSVAAQAAVAIDNASLYAKAQQAIEIRDAFLSIASHELKTPLTALQLQVQLLLRRFQSETHRETGAQLEGSLKRLMDPVRRLTRLIDELLDVSRLSLGRMQMHPEPVELCSLVREITGHFEGELEKSGSSFTLHAQCEVNGHWDRARLEQVFTNLFANAIKYGAGQPISVYVGKFDHYAIVQVLDSGIGIAKEDQSRIFQRFERAASAQNYGGLGLGLWIVRSILEIFGGQIDVESKLGEGSNFTVKLPLMPPHTP